jgi:Ca2+-binding RTX toxin-like protein
MTITFITPSSIILPEDVRSFGSIAATDTVPNETLTYTITGGADAAKFTLSSDGALDLIPIPNFESPVDADGDNVFVVQITATDTAGTKAIQNLAVTIANVDEMPVIANTIQIVSIENTTLAQSLPADNMIMGETYTYSIVGGADQHLFDAGTGSGINGITFLTAPDHEAATDANGDNVYLVDIEKTTTSSFPGGFPGGPGVPVVRTDTYAVYVSNNTNDDAKTVSAKSFSALEGTTTIGTVTATNPLLSGPLTYTLAGGADQAQFAVNPSTGALTFPAAKSFATPSDAGADNVYVAKVKIADANGHEELQTAAVSVASGAPTNVVFSADTVSEKTSTGTVVANLSATDPTPGDTFTYTLTDNAGGRFKIVGNQLQVDDASLLDFEKQTSHQVAVKVTDQGGLSKTVTRTILVQNANEAPTGLTLSAQSVYDHSANDTLIGDLLAFDPDANETFTAALTDDAGGRFKIVGNQIVVADGTKLDSAISASHTITVHLADAGGLTYDQTFSINVSNGTAGDDVIDLGGGDDSVDTGTGNDTVNSGAGNDTVKAGAGNDRINLGDGDDKGFGGSGKDLVDGGTGGDTIYGGDGNDKLIGGDGNDSIYGGRDDDRLFGGAGNDKLYAGDAVNIRILDASGKAHDERHPGNDMLYGGAGNDTFYGGESIANPTVKNSPDGVWRPNELPYSDKDTFYGGAGNDTFHVGNGRNDVYGGDGNDTIFSRDTHGFIDQRDKFDGGAGFDTLHLGYKFYGDDIGIDTKDGVTTVDVGKGAGEATLTGIEKVVFLDTEILL